MLFQLVHCTGRGVQAAIIMFTTLLGQSCHVNAMPMRALAPVKQRHQEVLHDVGRRHHNAIL